MNTILIYESADASTHVEVRFEGETAWLNRQQLALLFDRDIKTIGKHINKVFSEGELLRESVVAKFATTAKDGKTYQVEHYNLDVIISVGYRVNSKRGTQFRQWATKRLKDYLVQGYSLNPKRLEELGHIVQLIEQAKKDEGLEFREAKGLLDILGHYTRSFVLLNQFDSQSLSSDNFRDDISYEIDYLEAKQAIKELKKQLMAKKEATELFGNEKDESFSGILLSVVQTFGGAVPLPKY